MCSQCMWTDRDCLLTCYTIQDEWRRRTRLQSVNPIVNALRSYKLLLVSLFTAPVFLREAGIFGHFAEGY